MGLISIAKKNLVDEAYGQIFQMIANGIWKEGESLPSENQLCQDLGVSRVVVREVLQRLRAQNLIVTRQGVGSFVSNPNNFVSPVSGEEGLQLTEEAFIQVMEFRRLVEFELVKLAVERGTEEDLQQILSAVEGMASNIDDVEKYTLEDLRFHIMVGKAAHNDMMFKALISCQEDIFRCFYQMNRLSDALEWGVKMHRNVYNAIVQRNAKKAVQALKKANDYNHARLSGFFAGNP